MGLSNDLSCEAGSLSCCRPNPHWCFQSEVCLGCGSASLPAVCLVYLCANVGPRGATCRSACPVLHHSESGPLGLSVRMWGHRVCQWSDCLRCLSHTLPVSVPPGPRESSPPQLPVFAPPTSLDECFFFNFLVVGLPYSFIFWQLWLFFVFKFVVVVLLSVMHGSKAYLPTPLSWPE